MIVFTLALALPARAMDAVPLSLDALVDRAGSVVHAQVAEVVSGRDADGIPATWVTLDVVECLKGRAERRLVFKQVGVESALPDGSLLRLPGLPRYRAGEELVLFLHEPSGRGFTSPVGLGQGVLRVQRHGGAGVVRGAGATDRGEDVSAFLGRVRARASR